MVLEVADHDFAIRLSKFQLADPIWRLKIRKSLGFEQNWNAGVFEVTDQDFPIRLSKFKMAAKVWWLKIRKKLRVFS